MMKGIYFVTAQRPGDMQMYLTDEPALTLWHTDIIAEQTN